MIIEGLITTSDESGPHVSALGPVVDERLEQWTLRPFQTARAFERLRANPICVFHVIDDALPVVQLVLGQTPSVTLEPMIEGGWLVREACHWYQLEIVEWNLEHPRSQARARLVSQGSLRKFWGWNRAKHALLEAAILISRAHLVEPSDLNLAIQRLAPAIEKTAGPREQLAWQLIEGWMRERNQGLRSFED